MADDASDLESYLDDLEKHIDENDELVSSYRPEEDRNSGDAEDNDYDILEDAELEDGTIFMDAEGNYYYQSGKKAVQVKPIKKEKSIAKSVAAAIVLRKRKGSQTPPRPSKKEKPNSTKKAASVGQGVTTLAKKDVALKISSVETISPTKSTNRSSKMDTPAIKIEPIAKDTKVVTKARASTTKSDVTVASVDQTFASETENNEEIYNFDETEQNVDDPDYTVDDVDDPQLVKNEAILKPIGLTPDASGQFKCSICSYSTNKKFLLSRHLKSHSEERPYKCSVCERGFKTNISLMNHINTHLGNKPHQCEDCEKSFTTSGELTRHRRYRHTGIKPHKCTECDYSSVELSKLRRHIRCHTGERPFQCPHCTYASPDTFKLKRHMRTHTGEKPYECDICHARFTQSNSLKYHRLIHSVNDKPVFQCNLCPTTCGRKTDLRLHIQKLHNTETPFPCKRCGKELPDRYSYKMHVKTHEGEKCYRCTYCPYASISQRHLETHMLIHTDTKPFVCDLCQQSFRQKQLLTRHIKVYHTDNYEPAPPRKKAHICPHCDRSFAFKGNLMRHMETHDPNSRINEEKLKLKMGRMRRVQPDGTVVVRSKNPFIYNEEEEEELLEDEEDIIYDEENDEHIQYIYEELEQEDEEAVEQEEGEPIEQKPIVMSVKTENVASNSRPLTSSMKIIQGPQYKTVSVKKEVDGTEYMAVEVEDGQDYMVIEVMQEEEEEQLQEPTVEEEEDQAKFVEQKPNITKQTVIKSSSSTDKALKAITEDCFGFDDDAQADDIDDDDVEGDNDDVGVDNRHTLELMQMLQED